MLVIAPLVARNVQDVGFNKSIDGMEPARYQTDCQINLAARLQGLAIGGPFFLSGCRRHCC
jgi:hypothetical protein